MERTLRTLSFSLPHPAHVEKHSLNSGSLRGLMPTHTEKQTVLNTYREAQRYKRTHTGASPTKPHSGRCTQTHKHPPPHTHTQPGKLRYSRRTQLQTRLRTPRCGLCTRTPHTVPLGAQPRRHATLSPDPPDARVAQPRPTPAAPPSEEASLSPSMPSPPPPPKDVQTLLRINPGSWLLPARPRLPLPHSFSPVSG